MNHEYIERVINLTDPNKNIIFNMSVEEAESLVRSGDTAAINRIDGHFALVGIDGKTIRMARSIGRPLRYFIAKLTDGPCLVVANRIDSIYQYLKQEGLDDQFHPSYTRMVPAHYITTVRLLGCPDPNPEYHRFFTPERNQLRGVSTKEIGRLYMNVLYSEIKQWLQYRATTGPIGVSFSAGIDSGSVFLLVYHALLELGESPSRLKAFTLSVDGNGEDLQAGAQFSRFAGSGLVPGACRDKRCGP